jgi:hypothetical protein
MLTSHRPWSLAKTLQIPGGCGRAATAKDRRCSNMIVVLIPVCLG